MCTMVIKAKCLKNKTNPTTMTKDQQPDEFLPTINKIFNKARYFGVTNFQLTKALCWSLILFTLLFVLESFAIWKIIRLLGGWAVNTSGGEGLIGRLSGSIFYGNALLSLVISSIFIYSWKYVFAYWLNLETTTGLNILPDSRIKQRILFVTSLVSVFAIVEHSLSMMSATGLDCPPNEYLKRYILASHGFLINEREYSLWLAIPIFIVSKLATILWNFQDLIIMLISMGLTSRYHRLNCYVGYAVNRERRFKFKQKYSSELYHRMHVWRRLREAYVQQATLVRLVDRRLGSLVLLSNINNFYFICLQLFFGLHGGDVEERPSPIKDKGSPINKVYYFLSLGWLIFRACGVVLAASDVHVHSRRALIYLTSCPSKAYNVEIKRLQYQLTHDYVALTGLGFFSLNRELLLEVAAAIVKYELVLIQYDTE